jgi:hypothetical protein
MLKMRWVKSGEVNVNRLVKKAEQRIAADYLDGVLADFSGYIAADELYDGPFCVLSIVDNHTFKRLIYEVLDHTPTHEDMTKYFRRFRKELDQRSLTLRGVTTDGSPLYPEPLALIFPEADHQVCEFHVLKEINREILKAVTKVRRELKRKRRWKNWLCDAGELGDSKHCDRRLRNCSLPISKRR